MFRCNLLVNSFVSNILTSFNLKSALTLMLTCCFLASCSTQPILTKDQQADWEISGKIGIREGLLRAKSSIFQWRQQDKNYTIYIFNNLGQPQFTLSGNQTFALIQQADGKSKKATTPEELMQELTGWSFPLQPIRYWSQGKTYGDEQQIKIDNAGHLSQFSTDIWQVTLSHYKTVNQQALPHKIKLKKEDISLTLIIKQHAQLEL